MKAAIFNPYLDSLGGGERYTMAFATTLVSLGYKVDVQWKNTFIKKKLEERFGIRLNGIDFIPNINRGDGYDICFWLSDGSIPLLRARHNFLHFQFPFKDVNGRSLLNKMKLFRIEKIICNSYFTKKFIDKEYGVVGKVIYPPVDVKTIKAKIKENIILFVGRFSQLEQAKNQHVLVEAFKNIYKWGFKDWKLILAGGVEVGVDEYFEKLKRSARKYPIEIITSPDFNTIKDIYGKAKIFWSAVGFGINEKKDPRKVEHFGISVVEAMTAGAVPIVFLAGGYKEIIADGENGYLWQKKGDLIKKTKMIMEDGRLLRSLAFNAKSASKVYEYERFEAEVSNLIK